VFDELAATPGMGHTREDLTNRPVKFWRVYSNLLVHDPASVPLTVIAVLYGAREIERILQDLG
jgi:plasmid stabilization system protein ParE